MQLSSAGQMPKSLVMSGNSMLLLVFIFLGAFQARAVSPVPAQIAYEGTLTTTAGAPVDLSNGGAGTAVNYYLMSGNCVIYVEPSTANSALGDINYTLGSVAPSYTACAAGLNACFPSSGSLTGKDYTTAGACTVTSGSAIFLRVAVPSKAITADVALSSVPYVLLASDSLAVGGVAANKLVSLSGTITGFSWNDNQVAALNSFLPSSGTLTIAAVPVNGTDPTNKTYVDGKVAAVSLGTTLGTLAVAKGGTGLSATPANGQLLIGNGTGFTLGTLTSGAGISIANSAGAITISATGGGGSGTVTTVVTGAGLLGGPITTGGTLAVDVGSGANQIVQMTAAAKLPAVDGSLLTNLAAGNIATGVLSVARGGTNSATALAGNRLMVSSGGAIAEGSALANGQIFIGSTGALPIAAGLVSSNGISISTGAGSIGVSSNGTNLNTVNALVMRDGSGNFSAGAITNLQNILQGSTSGLLTLQAPASFANYSLTFPGTAGTNGQVLSSNGAGALVWANPGTGTVTNVASGAGLLGGPITTGGTLSVDIGTGVNQIVQLGVGGKLPAVDGSLLMGLTSAQVSGVLPLTGGTLTGALNISAGSLNLATGNITRSGNITGTSTANGSLVIDSTSNASKGNILLNPSNGKVGIRTATPGAVLDVNGDISAVGNIVTSAQLQTGAGSQGGPALTNAADTLTGIFYPATSVLAFSTAGSERVRIDANGNVGVGTMAPNSALQVNGAITSTTTAIGAGVPVADFATGNHRWTPDNCGTFALYNLKDGGTYTFVVKGTTSTTCLFNAYSDSGTAMNILTVHYPVDHGPTIATKQTMYNFVVLGTDVYVAWTPGY